jgi:hypothetical protein
MIKKDLKKAYRQIWVRALDQHLTGMHLPSKGYTFATRLIEGCRAAPGLFERFAEMIVFIESSPPFNVTKVRRWVDDSATIRHTLKEH